MITFYRTVVIAPGKLAGALAFAREVTALVKSKTGANVKIAMPIGGNPNRIGWTAQYENLAGYEQVMTKLFNDPKYQEIVAKSADNWVPNTLKDELWRDI